MKKTFLLPLAAALCAAGSVSAADSEAGFKSLFNGKDLSGWEGNTDLWSVRDGAITGRTSPSADDPQRSTLKHNTFLVYKGGEFGDFELRLSYRIVGGNSGVQYRSKVVRHGEMGPVVGGYQADFEAGKTYSGILYDEAGVAGGRQIMAQRGEKVVWNSDCQKEVTGSLGKSEDIQAKIKSEDWNDYVIVANGNRLQHFINGVQTVDVTDNCEAKRLRSGVLALQIHAGPPMTVQFKNIRIKELGQRSDLELMQGEWVLVEVMANGEAVNKDDFAHVSVIITGQAYEVRTRDGGDSGTFELNTTQKPAWLDATDKDGNRVRAIYEFKDGRLRVCYAGGDSSRPDDFTTSPDSGRILAVYQRR